MNNRQKAYETFYKPFDFFTKLHKLENSEIMVKANELCCIYKSDLEKNEFINELLHFRSHQITSFNEKKITPLLLLLVIYERNMKDLYPKIEIALRIFISIPATNCTAESSFWVLKRMKNYKKKTIESDLTSSLEYKDIIDVSSRIKSRKKPM